MLYTCPYTITTLAKKVLSWQHTLLNKHGICPILCHHNAYWKDVKLPLKAWNILFGFISKWETSLCPKQGYITFVVAAQVFLVENFMPRLGVQLPVSVAGV